MLIVLSPAKNLDFETPLRTRKHSLPEMEDETRELVDIMAGKSPEEIAGLMNLSDQLAELNWERFQEWQPVPSRANARPALLAFNGDVYQGMEVARFSERDFTYAQRNLRILSGLHGLLKPLDLIQPYRLEMGTKLPNSRGADLYDFWRDQVTSRLRSDLERRSPNVLVNLASKEYFGAVDEAALDARVLTPVFLDFNRDEYRIVSFFAKRARGAMASWIIRNRVKSIRSVRQFEELGYRYSEERSTFNRPVFTRDP